MPLTHRERQVQAAACRNGLKLIADRYGNAHKGRERYYLRPIWDARHVVRVLPDGGYELAAITGRKRYVVTPLPLDAVELLLSRWSKTVGALHHHIHEEPATRPAEDCDGEGTNDLAKSLCATA
jgi:hypothetical protein